MKSLLNCKDPVEIPLPGEVAVALTPEVYERHEDVARRVQWGEAEVEAKARREADSSAVRSCPALVLEHPANTQPAPGPSACA